MNAQDDNAEMRVPGAKRTPGAFTFRGGGGAALHLHCPVFVNRLDYLVLIATILAIPLYGLWRTRGSAS